MKGLKKGKNIMEARTARTDKKTARKNGPGKIRKKKGYFASVHCEKHGVLRSDSKIKELIVPVPRSKSEALLGCPACLQESKKIKSV